MNRYAAYQTRHRIEPVEEMHPDFARIHRCATDGIRVHPIRGGWRHDHAELVDLMDAEYGGPWSGLADHSLERAMERLAAPIQMYEGMGDDWDDRKARIDAAILNDPDRP